MFNHQPSDNGYNLTDFGNAERLVMNYGDIIMYAPERRRWLVYYEGAWRWDLGETRIKTLAKWTVRDIFHDAAAEDDDKRRKDIVGHALRSESDHRINSMISLAQSEPKVPVNVSELDAYPYLFNCENGTIDLKTGELLTHRKLDLQSIIVPVVFDQDAKCPMWMAFLNRVTDGDGDLQEFLQRAVGYSLTGDTKSQVMFFLYGLGNNGKSTFISVIRKITGEYGERVSTDLFMLKDKNAGGPKEGLANLRGKRFVVASELDDGRRLAVSLIKDMTGGETIKADRKYEHEFEFQPTHKLWLVGNHKPLITDTTLSIWRRLRLIPFTVTIPDNEVDQDLFSKLEEELPGILNWAVDGCLAWQERGLDEPRIVSIATNIYRHEQDILGDFIEDSCILDRQALLLKSEMKDAYHNWCQDNSNEPITQRTFRTRLIERGIDDHKGTAGQRYWRGIRLKTEQEVANEVANSGISDGDSNVKWQERQDSSINNNARGIQEKFMENTPSLATLPPYPDHSCKKCGSEWVALPDCSGYKCEKGHMYK